MEISVRREKCKDTKWSSGSKDENRHEQKNTKTNRQAHIYLNIDDNDTTTTIKKYQKFGVANIKSQAKRCAKKDDVKTFDVAV